MKWGGAFRRRPPGWTKKNRGRCDRGKLRTPSDLTDAEGARIAPPIAPAKHGGNKRTVIIREVVDAPIDVLRTGGQWRAIREDLAARRAAKDDFIRWNDDGTLDRIHHARSVKCRELAQRDAGETAGIMASHLRQAQDEGVSGAEPFGFAQEGASIDPHGDDARKINGKKRHVLVKPALLRHAIVDAADIQDRDGGVLPMSTRFDLSPFPRKLSADGGSQGARFQPGLTRVCRQSNVAIVKRSDAAKRFAVLPKRWIVEPTIACRNRCRGLAKDWACLNRGA